MQEIPGHGYEERRVDVLAGGLGGTLQTGRTLNYLQDNEDNRKMCSLYLSLMDRFGIKLDQFGDSRTRLEELRRRMAFIARLGEKTYNVEIEEVGKSLYRVAVDGSEFLVDGKKTGFTNYSLIVDKELGARVLEIPYAKERFGFVIALPDDDLAYLGNTMTNQRIRHLPVMQDGQLAGLVSIGDVVKAQLEYFQGEARILQQYISGGYV